MTGLSQALHFHPTLSKICHTCRDLYEVRWSSISSWACEEPDPSKMRRESQKHRASFRLNSDCRSCALFCTVWSSERMHTAQPQQKTSDDGPHFIRAVCPTDQRFHKEGVLEGGISVEKRGMVTFRAESGKQVQLILQDLGTWSFTLSEGVY